METLPKIGMTYNQVRSRLIGDSAKYKQNANLRASILYQVQLCEGEKAAHELANEVASKWGRAKNGRSLSGAGSIQVGIGGGSSCADDPSFISLGSGRYKKTY
jgi:hypothetical protein